MYKIIITDNWIQNIEFIKTYIWDYSVIVLKKVFHTISHLSYFPNSWFDIWDWLFEIIDSKYKFKIIYKIDYNKNIIYVVSIFKWKPTWN